VAEIDTVAAAAKTLVIAATALS